MNQQLNEVKTKLTEIKATRKAKELAIFKINKTIDNLKAKIVTGKFSVTTANMVYDERVASFFKNLEDTVSYGLTKVFNKVYDFKIEYKTSGTKFLLASEDTCGEYVSIMDAHGGGIVQVTAFILHAYALSYSNADKILILDEPFNNVSKEYKEVLAVLISELTDKLGFQFIMVSHDQELMDYLAVLPETKLYKTALQDGATQIKLAG